MKTLYLDARARYQKIVSLKEGDLLIAEVSGEGDLLKLIAQLVNQTALNISEISKVEVNTQGGSFTGVRLSLSVARSFVFALGLPEAAVVSG
ncbi:MAG: hypothetical protein AAB486_04575 [Patescibacteria group bacterium]